MTADIGAFAGRAIYLDTMVPYALLRSVNPTAEIFFDHLETGTFLAYISVLTFDELTYRLLLALIKERYHGSPLDHLRDEEESLIAEFAPSIIDRLRRLRYFQHLTILDTKASEYLLKKRGDLNLAKVSAQVLSPDY